MAMVIQLPRDINRFCRTCMNVTENNDGCYKNNIILNKEPTDVLEILQSVTSLDITSGDGLPETLCPACMEQLTAAYTFINQCKSVDADLRNILGLVERASVESTEFLNTAEPSLAPPESDKFIRNEDVCYGCKICSDVFKSYYQLSMHMIEHNRNKTLFDRLLSQQNLDSNLAINSTKPVDLDAEVLDLVEERKLSLKFKNVKTISNNAQENMDIDVNADTLNVKDNKEDLMKERLDKALVECKLCTKRFIYRSDLISHLCTPVTNQDQTTRLLTVCTLCEKDFSDCCSLSIHFLNHALATTNTSIENEFFFCELCGETFESETFLSQHYNETHEGKPTWICATCSEIFGKEKDLLRHSAIHTTVESETLIEKSDVPCVICNGMFPTKTALLKHSIEHLMKKYSCKKCLLSFCTQYAYSEHLKLHGSSQHTCPTCGKVVGSKSALKSHIVGVHSVDLRHICGTCGKGFATRSRLKTHSQIHKNTKKYICSYCGYRAHKVGDLQIHTRIHTSERPYKCTFANCSASFKTSSHLCDHVRRHLQIRKFKCTICAATFSTNHSLKVHQLQHTGERPYSCVVCNQRFRRKYHVSVHMKQHQPKA